MRFHSLAIPCTISNEQYNACAYTQKVVKFSKMMLPRGHEIFHYGHKDSTIPCTENIEVTNDDVLFKAYGRHDWHSNQMPHNINDYAHTHFNSETIKEIKKRIRPNDFVLCWWGNGHQPIGIAAEECGAIIVEPGIGYDAGHFAQWRAYESHCIRNIVEGNAIPQKWYSWVIPNYFDENEFEYSENKEDYFLYLGRVQQCKGVGVAIEATKHAGVKLKIAGQGSLFDIGYNKCPTHCEYLGHADIETRKKLMSKAKGLIIASQYLEPFGGVQVESLLSGTPVIAPHYGAFAEILEDHKTGFLCHTLKDYVDGIKSVGKINPKDCRNAGLKYTLENVAPQFEKFFNAIHDVYNKNGWATLD